MHGGKEAHVLAARRPGPGEPGRLGERCRAHLRTRALRPERDVSGPKPTGRCPNSNPGLLEPEGRPVSGPPRPPPLAPTARAVPQPGPAPPVALLSPPAFTALGAGPAPGPAPLLPGLSAAFAAAPRPRHGCRRRRHLSTPSPQQQLYRQAQHRAGPPGRVRRAAGRGRGEADPGGGAVGEPGEGRT